MSNPGYTSFETALAEYGILSQIPYTMTFANTKYTKKLVLDNVEIEYRKIKSDLFFGFYFR